MRRRTYFSLVAGCALCIACGIAFGQEAKKPQAFLRLEGAQQIIRVSVDMPLPSTSKLLAVLTNGDQLLKLDDNVKDCETDILPGQFCKEVTTANNVTKLVQLSYKLPAPVQPADTYKVRFAITDTTTGAGKFQDLAVTTDFVIKTVETATCPNGIKYTIQAASNGAGRDYVRQRVEQINTWLKNQEKNPAGMALVKVQSRTKEKASEITVKDFSVTPNMGDATRDNQRTLNVARAVNDRNFSICLMFADGLPTGEFDSKIKFLNEPPVELAAERFNELQGAALLAGGSSEEVTQGKELGLRGFDNNLDLGFILASSVEDKKEENENKEMVTVRARETTFTFDLRFAPFLREMSRPTTGWRRVRTPFFIDAKVSNGKIDEDTLSLNRILIGTEYNLRYLQGTAKGERNRYIITFRGVNASDRDFKRAEITGEVEFRPLFERLNQPLKIQRREAQRELQTDPEKKVLIIAGPEKFGYQIQPFFGVNGGRLYRQRRDVLTGEESDNVRRFYFGADLIFDLTERFKLTLTDTFYIRGETPADRGRNYFNGELETLLGGLHKKVGHSLYFAFERGDQPPFSSAGANTFKAGYRIRSNFFSLGTAR